MKKLFVVLLLLCLCFSLCACRSDDKVVLTESTFFYGMTVIQDYPEEYLDTEISFDCFTYRLTDVDGNSFLCGVRKCSSAYGCKCGNDTVIGFILDYDGEIPEPINQSEDTVEKAWIHVEGKLASDERERVRIYAYQGDEVNYSSVETVVFLHFAVFSLTPIEDYSGLAYYITK